MTFYEFMLGVVSVLLTIILVHVRSNSIRRTWETKVEKELQLIRVWIRLIAQKQSIELPEGGAR